MIISIKVFYPTSNAHVEDNFLVSWIIRILLHYLLKYGVIFLSFYK